MIYLYILGNFSFVKIILRIYLGGAYCKNFALEAKSKRVNFAGLLTLLKKI